MPSLDELAHRFHADKQSGQHGYTRFYERHLRDRKVQKLLEIGILKGASLCMWCDFLPDAQIYGIDLDPVSVFSGQTTSRIHRDLVDQSDRKALQDYAQSCGPWDVIVDDGSHYTSHQIGSFEVLWPFVVAGGFYAVEDAFCSFLPTYADHQPTLFEYFHAMTVKNHQGEWYSDDSRTAVDFIEFSTGLIVIGKAA